MSSKKPVEPDEKVPVDTSHIESALEHRLNELCYVLGKRPWAKYVRDLRYIVDDIKAAKE